MFRYRAKNDIGYSLNYSATLVTYGAKAPAQMMPPQTEISQLNVRVFWTSEAELDSGGIPLSGYGILLRTWNNTYVPTSYCNGTNSTLISSL